jgi:putative hemolysin
MCNKPVLLVSLSLIFLTLTACAKSQPERIVEPEIPVVEPEGPVNIRNPVEVYCTGLGYEFTTRVRKIDKQEPQSEKPVEPTLDPLEGPQPGIPVIPDYYEWVVCAFPDGNECEEEEFRSGRCGSEYTYCDQQGYTLEPGISSATCVFTDAFVRECFLDEMAHALGRDPYELRLELLPSQLHNVLETVVANSSWGEPLPPGSGRGIACWSTWNVTPVAQVAEVSVSEAGQVHVHRVVCAIDCGLVVNPDMVIAQMESGIVWGLTAALKGSIDIENGSVLQSNFADYPILKIDEMPQVEVHLVSRDRRPTGVGEMGVPPAAPAVLNAIFAATGKRIRHIPVQPQDLI